MIDWRYTAARLAATGLAFGLLAAPAVAQEATVASTTEALPQRDKPALDPGGRLLLTGGVSTIEGAGGGGIVPWALIGGYGTRNELGV